MVRRFCNYLGKRLWKIGLGGGSGGGKIWLCVGYIKEELKEFFDGLDMVCERIKELRMILSFVVLIN